MESHLTAAEQAAILETRRAFREGKAPSELLSELVAAGFVGGPLVRICGKAFRLGPADLQFVAAWYYSGLQGDRLDRLLTPLIERALDKLDHSDTNGGEVTRE